MRRLALLSILAGALCGCTTAVVDAPDALQGKDIQNAVALFGPWHERRTVNGRVVYIWRRTVEVDGSPQGCELSVEMGFRGAVARSLVQGYPAACSSFRVIYEPDRR
ncbi:hypothetical protein [Phenylobacterium deserti]|uniref:Lipoprotein n=1 Tax=Phenylobacterium deserti TaxID=1914756 RepID=A0A328AD11_9CAUL|nr:hypothetical protein [Phenylobacterium deserti]RAK52559.1 hypothetical protein DJ018_10115 [Phenylobacterium deserti]